MVTQYVLLQKQIDPKLTVLFKETNPHHPDIISDGNGFAIVIEDWEKGIYRFVNSTKEGNKTNNEHFTPNNAQPLKTIYDLNRLWKVMIGKELTYIGKSPKIKEESNYKKDKTGEIHMSNGYGEVEILQQKGWDRCKIRFLEDGTVLDNQQYGRIKRGEVRNPYKKVYYGIGYMGVGKYNSRHKSFKKWQNMMQRSYDEVYHIKYPSYKTVTVCDEWCNYQSFAKWYDENYKSEFMEGWCLDKDLLSSDSKIYSPKTCCFLPQSLNKLLTHIHTIPIITNRKGRYYTKINKGKKILRFSVFDTKDEAISRYKDEKRAYSLEILSQYSSLLSDIVVVKIQRLIDLI